MDISDSSVAAIPPVGKGRGAKGRSCRKRATVFCACGSEEGACSRGCCCARRCWLWTLGATAVLAAAVLLCLRLAGYLTPPPPLPAACALPWPGCAEFDASGWSRVLARHATAPAAVLRRGVNFTGLDYAGVAADADFARFCALLEATDVAALNRSSQAAFFVNAYNALAVRMVLEHPCGAAYCGSIRDITANAGLQTVWKMRAGTLAGRGYTLDNIEHDTLRAALLAGDARVHAALNCASVSCPDLAQSSFALRAGTLDADLDAAARAWLANDAKGLAVEGGGALLRLSRIFHWYGGDFAPSAQAWAAQYAPLPLRAAARAAATVDFFGYDWGLNSAA